MEYKLNRLGETATGVAQNLFQRDEMKGIIDGLTSVLEVVDAVTGKIGILGTVAAGVSLGALIKNFEQLKFAFSFVKEFGIAESFKMITSSISASTIALGEFAVGVAAIAGVVAIVDALTESYEDAQEAAQEAISNSEENHSKLDTINSDLDETKSRIEELKSKGSLTLVEQEELDKLERTNQQLELQKKIQENVTAVSDRTAALKASHALTKTQEVGVEYVNKTATDPIYGNTITYVDQEKVISKNIIEIAEEEQKKIEKLNKDYDDTLKKQSEIKDTTSDEWKENQEHLELLDEQIEKTYTSYEGHITDINKYRDALINQETGELWNPKDADILERIVKLFSGVEEKQANVNNLLSRPVFKEATEQLKEIAQEYNGITADKINVFFPELASAAKKAGIDIQDVVDTINSEVGTIDLSEAKKQLESLFDGSEYTDAQRKEWKEWIEELDDEEIKILYNIENTDGWSIEDFELALRDAQNKAKLTVEIDVETEKFTNLQTAIQNSFSATGMTSEDITNVKDMFSSLKGYDAGTLFENTANGVTMNTSALKLLNAEYENQNKLNIQEYLKSLKQEYNELSNQLTHMSSEDAGYNTIKSRIESVKSEAEEVQQLAAQYDGLTSAYNKFVQAQSGESMGDSFKNIANSFTDMKKIADQGWGGNSGLNAYLDLIYDSSQRTGDAIEDFARISNETLQGTSHTLADYFTFDEDGNLLNTGLADFVDDIQAVQDAVGDTFVTIDKDGNTVLDLTGDKLQKLAEYWGFNTELMEQFGRGLAEMGMEVNLDNDGAIKSIDEIKSAIEESEAKLKEMGEEPFEVDLNVSSDKLDSTIQSIKEQIEDVNQNEIDPEVKTAKIDDLNNKLEVAIQKKVEASQPMFMELDTSEVDSSLTDLLAKVQEYQTELNKLTKLEQMNEISPGSVDSSKIDEANQKVQGLAEEIAKFGERKLKLAGFDTSNLSAESIQKQIGDNKIKFGVELNDDGSIEKLSDKIKSEKVKLDVTVEGEEKINKLKFALGDLVQKFKDTTISVVAKVTGTDKVQELTSAIKEVRENKDTTANVRATTIGTEAVERLVNAIRNVQSKDVTINATTNQVTNKITNRITNRTTNINGTANASGTAKLYGDWGNKQPGVSLVGELGPEIIVSPDSGKWQTVGDNGAEFRYIPKNAIVFNHRQTEELLKNGSIDSRGTLFANGTAYAQGTALLYGRGVIRRSEIEVASRGEKPDTDNNSNKDKSTDDYKSGYNDGYDKGYSSATDNNNNNNNNNTNNNTSTDNGYQTQSVPGQESGSRPSSSTKTEKTPLEKFQDWFSKLFDWIEIKLERQTDKISKYISRAEAATDDGRYSSAARNYRKGIDATATQVSNEQEAAREYNKQADKVLRRAANKGLIDSSDINNIKTKVADGSMDISKYNDEMKEVISDYQEWADKARNASSATNELHSNISGYVKSLKSVHDAQRDAKIERIGSYTTIATSNTAFTPRAKNRQLSYQNRQLSKENSAYEGSVNAMRDDVYSLGYTARMESWSKEGKDDYNAAIRRAKLASSSYKPVSTSDLQLISRYDKSLYERYYAYNEALSQWETAKLEGDTKVAENMAQIYENIAQMYNNNADKINNDITTLKQKAENRGTNVYLDRAADKYTDLLTNDRKMVNNFAARQEKADNKIAGDISSVTYKYSSSRLQNKDKDILKEVDKVVLAARKQARKGDISESTLANVAKYHKMGYITGDFYRACEDHNNARQWKESAQNQLDSDFTTVEAELKSLSQQRLSNYQTKRDNAIEKWQRQNSGSTAYYTSTSDFSSIAENSQLKANNKLVKMRKSEYNKTVAQTRSDLYKSRNTAVSQTYTAYAKSKTGTEYNKALSKALLLLRSGKKVPNSTLDVIKKYNVKLWRRIVTNNENINNHETALQERAANAAADIAEETNNIRGQYENSRQALSNKSDYYKTKANNATSAKAAMSSYNKAISAQQDIYDTYAREASNFKARANKNAKNIKKSTGIGENFSTLAGKVQKTVRGVINKAKKAVKAGKAIDSNTMGKLEQYAEKGYITENFYDQCEYWNNNLEAYNEAKADMLVAKETMKEDIASLVEEQYSKIKDERDKNIQKQQNLATFISSMFASTSDFSSLAENGQLKVTNASLVAQNREWNNSVKLSAGELNTSKNKSVSGINKALKTAKNTKYKSALLKALAAVKGGKQISDSVLDTIFKNNKDLYKTLYTYNQRLINHEEMENEALLAKVANDAEKNANRAQMFENSRQALNNKAEYYSQKSDNAQNAKTANKYIDKTMSAQVASYKKYQDEIDSFNQLANTNANAINKATGKGTNYSAQSVTARKNIDKVINNVKALAKAHKPIPADTMQKLYEWAASDKKYVSASFVQSCAAYNDELQHEEEAKANKLVQAETLKANAKANADEKLSNLQTQRDENIGKLENRNRVTTGFTSMTDFSSDAENAQLESNNRFLLQKREEYVKTKIGMQEIYNTSKKQSQTLLNNALKTAAEKTAYRDALNEALSCVKAGKKVSDSVLDVIAANDPTGAILAKLVEHNANMDNLETARIEQAIVETESITEAYANIEEMYANNETAKSNRIDYLQRLAENAKTADEKNAILDEVAVLQRDILTNSQNRLADYTQRTNDYVSTITGSTGYGSDYSETNDKQRQAVNTLIEQIKQKVKSGEPIDATMMDELYDYMVDGWVAEAFYNACFDYNTAAEYKKQAEAAELIAEQAYKTELESIGSQRYSNVQREYENKLNDIASKRGVTEAKQSFKTTKGIRLTAADYGDLIESSRQEEQVYADEITRLNNVITENLNSGYWTTDSEAYKEAMRDLDDYRAKVIECQEAQEGWNNKIIELPFTEIEKALDLLDSIKSKYESLLDIDAAKGIVKTAEQYRKEIELNNEEIEKLEKEMSLAEADLEKARANDEGVYGGMSIDEWEKKVNEFSTSINKVIADNITKANEIAQLPLDKIQEMLGVIESAKSEYESLIGVQTAKGLDETVEQHQVILNYLEQEKQQYREQADIYEQYLKEATENEEGVANGHNVAYWTEQLNKAKESINNVTKAQIEENNAIAQIPYDEIQKVLDLIEAEQSFTKSVMDLKSAKGIDLSEDDYLQQIKHNDDRIAQIEQERIDKYNDYQKALADPEGVYGGKTAEKLLAEYYEFGATINEIKTANEELKDSLRDDVYWRVFERAHEAAQQFENILSGLAGLIDDTMYFDKDNKITKYGVAQIANFVSEYENARKEVENYQNDIANLNSLYAKGEYTQKEYTDKLNELQTELLNSASSMKSFSDSIIDMYKEMGQAELDSLFELIDARNEALTSKKACA